MRGSEALVGEPLALDLVNTRPADGAGGHEDLLRTPRQLAEWLVLQADRIPHGIREEVPGRADLAPVHAVRDHTAAVVRALLKGNAPPKAALRGLTEAQRAAPPVRELGWDGTAVTAAAHRAGPLGVRLAALLAEAAADLLADPAISKVKECAAGDCVMLFLPSHPRRRWCSPTRCGNRARVARYYQRHRPATTPGE